MISCLSFLALNLGIWAFILAMNLHPNGGHLVILEGGILGLVLIIRFATRPRQLYLRR